MDTISLMFLIVVGVAFLLYMQIQKLTQNIDKDEAFGIKTLKALNDKLDKLENLKSLEDKSQKYKSFCDDIDFEIRNLRQRATDDDLIKSEEFKDEFLADLSRISRKLVFIQTMNSKKDSATWEAELFEVLNGIENSVNNALKNPDEINSLIKDRLYEKFSVIKD